MADYDLTTPEGVVEAYVDCTWRADTETLSKLFHPRAVMAGDLPGQHIFGGPEPFFADLASRPSMASQDIDYRHVIERMEVHGNTASITLSEENFFGEGRFVNFLNLVKEGDGWKIAAKIFTYK